MRTGFGTRPVDPEEWAATLLAEVETAHAKRGVAARDSTQPAALRESVEHSYQSVLHFGLEDEGEGRLTGTTRRSEQVRPTQLRSRRRSGGPSAVSRSLSTMRPAEYVGRLGQSSTRLSTTGRYDAQRGQPKDTLSALREDIMHSYEEACDELEVSRGGEAMETPRRSRHVSSLRRHIREADETTAIVETQTLTRHSTQIRPPSKEMLSSSRLLYPADSLDTLRNEQRPRYAPDAVHQSHDSAVAPPHHTQPDVSHGHTPRRWGDSMQARGRGSQQGGGVGSAMGRPSGDWSSDRLDKWLGGGGGGEGGACV
mmetsp:Transcript_16240/g.28908  ORF Transcript_16240/g.28908 Transcript_16240/m.28908 type:complete len:312 (-) Transcript_16240:130-1065(-)